MTMNNCGSNFIIIVCKDFVWKNHSHSLSIIQSHITYYISQDLDLRIMKKDIGHAIVTCKLEFPIQKIEY